jgi:glycosyltransferase involved in cell wall biosynthesis
VLVLDACSDATVARAREALAGRPGPELVVLEGPGRGAGAARRLGMDDACRRLERAGRGDDGLIASTDADSVVGPDWLRVQLDLLDAGAAAIGGLVEVAGDERTAEALARREGRLAGRMARARAAGSAGAEHPFFGGASMAISASAYRRVGGLPEVAALEDQALERSLEARGIPIVRSRAVRVRTSARTDGRARHGLAADLRLDAWAARRSLRAGDYDARALARGRRQSVSLVLPAREVASTVGSIVDALLPLRDDVGLVDDLVVVDAASADGTARVAADHGARVVQESEILPGFGPARGKGDAMWRALAVTEGDIVAYLDADTERFDPRFAVGLIGPLLSDPGIHLVKGAFRRPLRAGGALLPDEGGRVTELVARPLLALLAPELGGFAQPLAGETAARRDLLESIPFPVGYGVETAMLLDALAARGLDALAQVDLGERLNRHQPLRELGGMALAVMAAGLRRGLPEAWLDGLAPGRMTQALPDGSTRTRDVPVEERPPLASLAPAETAQEVVR